jgi:hypothetical protein
MMGSSLLVAVLIKDFFGADPFAPPLSRLPRTLEEKDPGTSSSEDDDAEGDEDDEDEAPHEEDGKLEKLLFRSALLSALEALAMSTCCLRRSNSSCFESELTSTIELCRARLFVCVVVVNK